ncbi:MAG: MFS transporter [Actinomycetota bacterium]|nr:MFS transporter [Actinomycetota bacterium]
MLARAPVTALVAVLLVRLADEAAYFLPSGTLESFRADLGLTYAQAGTVLAVVGPGAFVGGAFTVAADRFSRRAIAAGGAFGFALALAAFGLGPSFEILLAAAFVMGVASTAMVDAAEVALVELAGDDLRRYLTRSNLLATIGDLAGPALVVGVAVAGLSWRWAFLVAAVLMGVYGVLLAASPLPAPRRGQDAADAGSETGSGLWSVVTDRRVWMLALVGVLMNPFDEPLVGFTIALLEEVRGASTSAATVVTVIGLAGGVVTYAVLARPLDAWSDDALLVRGAFLVTAAAVVITTVPVVPVVAVGAFVASVGLNIAWLGLQHRTLTIRPGQVGATKAVLSTAELSGFWIPVAIGAAADAAGLVVAVGIYVLLGTTMIGLTNALASAGPRQRGRDRRPA